MTEYIPKAVIAAGLPESDVPDIMAVVTGGASALADYTPAVAAAAQAALSDAYCKAILYAPPIGRYLPPFLCSMKSLTVGF
jgi:hypothetical protein